MFQFGEDGTAGFGGGAGEIETEAFDSGFTLL
jgi:hypothetical protein